MQTRIGSLVFRSLTTPFSFVRTLQPVCESLGRQCAVDLTKQASFHVGRSPNADIQLLHATSSRRHAMLFHHSNGSCYIIDCGSAHGTYVNGAQIAAPTKGGVVVPHRVRRGALFRFGGPGAPSFVLKSFSFTLFTLNTAPTTQPRTMVRSVLSSVAVPSSKSCVSMSMPVRTLPVLSITVKRQRKFSHTIGSLSAPLVVPNVEQSEMLLKLRQPSEMISGRSLHTI